VDRRQGLLQGRDHRRRRRQVALYAPHIRTVSLMHPHIVDIGYHCRDYFVEQWDRFKDAP
jgi:hypothetical protein